MPLVHIQHRNTRAICDICTASREYNISFAQNYYIQHKCVAPLVLWSTNSTEKIHTRFTILFSLLCFSIPLHPYIIVIDVSFRNPCNEQGPTAHYLHEECQNVSRFIRFILFFPILKILHVYFHATLHSNNSQKHRDENAKKKRKLEMCVVYVYDEKQIFEQKAKVFFSRRKAREGAVEFWWRQLQLFKRQNFRFFHVN